MNLKQVTTAIALGRSADNVKVLVVEVQTLCDPRVRAALRSGIKLLLLRGNLVPGGATTASTTAEKRSAA